MRKLLNVFDFFKTTLLINLAVSSCSIVFGGFDVFYVAFVSFGFLLSILFKEVYRKQDYLFYANNGVSKVKLIMFSYFLNIPLIVLIAAVIILIKKIV